MKKYYLIFYILGTILIILFSVYSMIVLSEYNSNYYSVVTFEQAMTALGLAVGSGICFLVGYILDCICHKRRLKDINWEKKS